MTQFSEDVCRAWQSGVLIALCGIDGSGKSTILAALQDRLRASGFPVTLTQQPTNFYRQARPVRDYHDRGAEGSCQEALALLSAADRLLHVKLEVVPALTRGDVVLSHRFLDATYAIFAARGLDRSWLRQINQFCPPAHATILLDCPGDVACERIARRGGAIRLEERSPELLERIRREYLAGAAESTLVVDALLPSETVIETCEAHVRSAIATRRSNVRS
ncbi:MAG TPA: dTMP kinase [Gemmatimonadaceae bacterium]